ncbi:MAG TPA: type II toxin-antitoxin system death-on-curing family toxin [Lacipirellulaceae bacterium]|jgi:death-on-curing protein|nr:type II toxin-antitoxin system death-on-curing family toxin [Lacipirellulaceae bacterium]
MREPQWLLDSVVLAIHTRQLSEHGGMDGVRDSGLLSSALSRPRHAFAYSKPQPDLATLAAAYAFGIVKNHPFVDGNKRTGYVVSRTFLIINGTDIDTTQEEKYQAVIALAEGSSSEEQFANWIRSKLVER